MPLLSEKSAAQYLETQLQQGDLLGIGWGETISKMLENIHFESSINLSIVTLTGGVNHYLPRKQNYLHYMQGDLHIIPTPFLASTTEMAKSILSEPSVKDMLHVASLAQTAVVGIGGLSQDATIVREEKLTLREMTYIRSQNGTGDILGQFYNTNGDLLELPHHNRLIGTPLLYSSQYETCHWCGWRYRKDRCNLWCLKRKVHSYINYR